MEFYQINYTFHRNNDKKEGASAGGGGKAGMVHDLPHIP